DGEPYTPAAEHHDDPFWTPQDEAAADAPLASAPEEHAGATAHAASDLYDDDLDLDVPAAPAPYADATPAIDEPPPPGKNDYLAAARRAAQAQSLPKTRPDPGPTPQLSLRGSSRIVLWGAASGIALLLVGGAYFFGGNRHAPAPAQPTPE